LLVPAAVTLGVVTLLALASPERAEAVDLNPIHAIEDVLGAGARAVTGGVGKVAVEAFGAILKALFAWPAKLINREVLGWLVSVPNYTIHPETADAGRDGSNLAQLGATTSAMAFASLGAVGTVAVIRYWAAGLTGSGGLEALEGLARTVGAALFIVLWPWLFRHCADLANQAGKGLLGSGSVVDDTARLLALAFLAGVTFNILAILIAIGAAVLFLALLMTKIAVSATTAVVFVAMPLAVMLWPIPELAWIARAAMRAFAVVLAIPLAWAVCFATFAAVGTDALALKGAGKIVDALVMPLVALALLWITVRLPTVLAQLALGGALAGGGFGGRVASYATARRLDGALTERLPTALGGNRGSERTVTLSEDLKTGEQRATATRRMSGRQAEAATSAFRAQRAGAAARRATAASSAVGAAAAVGGAQALPAHAQNGGWKPPKGFEQPGAEHRGAAPSGAGLRNPSWQEIKDHVPVELAAAAARQRAVTRADVATAMRALSPDARDAVMRLMDAKGGQIRGQMAHQAARGDLSDPEREAFRTLAAATPEVRARGIGDFIGVGTGEPSPTSPPINGAGASRPATRAPDEPRATPPMSGFDAPTQDGAPGAGGSGSAPAAPVADGGPMGPPTPDPPPRRAPDPPGGGDGVDGRSIPPPRGGSEPLSN
jgi:hypothetical protein